MCHAFSNTDKEEANVGEENSCRFQGQVKSIKMSFMVVLSSRCSIQNGNHNFFFLFSHHAVINGESRKHVEYGRT